MCVPTVISLGAMNPSLENNSDEMIIDVEDLNKNNIEQLLIENKEEKWKDY